ncbi:hypothetical protein B5M42_005930 [Paenibacillus athensensis]|nr:hypothetical protein [Paenibacillus athensensis]MCD1258379.1 hypothetical protein [Paenibacillus athensensis]
MSIWLFKLFSDDQVGMEGHDFLQIDLVAEIGDPAVFQERFIDAKI